MQGHGDDMASGKTLTPEELDTLYREHLLWTLMPPVAAHVTRGQTRAMLVWMESHRGRRIDPLKAADSWAWSDLHLNHGGILEHGKRPFTSTRAMRNALLEAWEATVGAADTIVCLGDVTVGPPVPGLDDTLAALPGDKLLVVGNHEFDHGREAPKDYGFEAVHPTLVVDSDPALLLTHEPLGTVPAGHVNVHGHLHGSIGPVSRRHLNVNVEQIGYRPVRVSALIETAKALLSRRTAVRWTTAKTIAATPGARDDRSNA